MRVDIPLKEENETNLLSCSSVNTTAWLDHFGLKKHKKKLEWKLDKNVACYYERILRAAPYKTVVEWPFTAHLTNYPRKARHAELCWRCKDKLRIDILLWTPLHCYYSQVYSDLVIPVGVQSMGLIDMFKNDLYSIGLYAKQNFLRNNYSKSINMNISECDFLTPRNKISLDIVTKSINQ